MVFWENDAHERVLRIFVPYAISNFAFLERLHGDFTREFRKNRIANAKSLALNKKFLPTVRSVMHYYNINHKKLSREQKVQRLMDKVEDMKSVMGRNIQLVLRHQQQELDQLMEQSEAMKADTKVFKRKSELLVNTQRDRKRKWSIGAVVLVLGVTYLLLAAVCGFNFYHCRIRDR